MAKRVVAPAPEPEASENEEPTEPEQAVVEEQAAEVEETKPAPAKPTGGAEQDKKNFLPEIPSHAQYLIVGGGTAAMSAFKAIRARDPKAKVDQV